MPAIVGWIGLACELGGIGFALFSLYRLRDQLFPDSALPPEAAQQWMKRLLRRQMTSVETGQMSARLGGISVIARGGDTKERPSDDAPLTEWNEYWDSRLAAVSVQIASLNGKLKEVDNDLSERLGTETAVRHKADLALDKRLRVALGGEGGRGLVKAWWGLAVTGLGALLQGLTSWP